MARGAICIYRRDRVCKGGLPLFLFRLPSPLIACFLDVRLNLSESATPTLDSHLFVRFYSRVDTYKTSAVLPPSPTRVNPTALVSSLSSLPPSPSSGPRTPHRPLAMRCLSLSVSRAALVCLFMAILRVHALVVIPSDALPQRLDADDAPPASERGPPAAWDWDSDSDWDRAPSHPAGARPAPSLLPTVTRVLPSHAPWYTQLPPEDATSLGHAPATFPEQGTGRSSRQRVLDGGGDDNAVAWQESSPREQSASWTPSPASDRDHPPRRGGRRRPSRPDDAGRSDDTTSEDTKVSVLAVAVVGVVLGCHYLDYL